MMNVNSHFVTLGYVHSLAYLYRSLIRPAWGGGANLCFPPCWCVVNLFPSSASDFSPHGYEVISSIAWPSSIEVPKMLTTVISNIVSEGFDKCEVIPNHQGPTKLKRVFCQDYEIFGLLNICFITRWPAVIILK